MKLPLRGGSPRQGISLGRAGYYSVNAPEEKKINCSSAAQEELIPRSERDRCLEHLYPALAKMSIKTIRRSSQRGCSDPNHIKITLDFLS